VKQTLITKKKARKVTQRNQDSYELLRIAVGPYRSLYGASFFMDHRDSISHHLVFTIMPYWIKEMVACHFSQMEKPPMMSLLMVLFTLSLFYNINFDMLLTDHLITFLINSFLGNEK
jgi:hypothetical protein